MTSDPGGSMWKTKVPDLPSNLVAELLTVTKPDSPEYFVTSIGDTRYVCYSSWINESFDLFKRRNQAHHL